MSGTIAPSARGRIYDHFVRSGDIHSIRISTVIPYMLFGLVLTFLLRHGTLLLKGVLDLKGCRTAKPCLALIAPPGGYNERRNEQQEDV
jgi:hypothetical protein